MRHQNILVSLVVSISDKLVEPVELTLLLLAVGSGSVRFIIVVLHTLEVGHKPLCWLIGSIMRRWDGRAQDRLAF